MRLRNFRSAVNLGSRNTLIGGDGVTRMKRIDKLEIIDALTNSGLRLGSDDGGTLVISNISGVNIGRTGALMRGRPDSITMNNVRFDNLASVHGNSLSSYPQNMILGAVNGFSARNSVRPFTNYGQSGQDARLTVTNFFMSPSLTPAGDPRDYTGIVQYNGTYHPGLEWVGGLMVAVGPASNRFAVSPVRRQASMAGTREGKFTNAVIEGINIPVGSDPWTYTFENVLVTKATSSCSSPADITAAGGTIVNNSVTFVTQLFDGQITREMWEVMTRVGQTGSYAPRQIPGFPEFPAFGATLDHAALTCNLNRARLPRSWPANYSFCSIEGYLPCCTVSIDPADGDNTELGAVLVRGDLQFTVTGPTTPKNLVITLTPVTGAGYSWSATTPKKITIPLPVSGY